MILDLHVHTHHSADSAIKPRELIEEAKRRGLGGFAVTDHNRFAGALEAKKLARDLKSDLVVIPGEEVLTERGEVLAYFIGEEIEPGRFEDVMDDIARQGGVAALPHPFDRLRRRFDFRGCRRVDEIAAVETFNARVVFREDNERAEKFAEKNEKTKIGGSDAHFIFEFGNGKTETKASDEEGLRKAIKERATKAVGKNTSLFVHGVTKFLKIARKIKK
ncbi:MAG: PHP domain-containing protein [Candidatus Micrarchaeota archaeon]